MNITELLIDLASGINSIIRFTAKKFNITSSQALHLFSIPFDGVSMSAMSHKLGLDASTLTRNIQKLEKLGLVERRTDSYDKRIQRVVLTNDGTALIDSLEDHLEKQNHSVLEKIDLDTQEALLTVLEKLSWAISCTREKS